MERARVLIPTNRSVYRLVSYGMVVDFEDAVAAVSDADVVPVPVPSRRARAKALRHGKRLSPIQPPRASYDICLFVAMGPEWIESLHQIRNLRRVARQIIVYLFDSWVSDIDSLRRHRRALSLVDRLFVSFSHAVDAYSSALDCPVDYLPQAIDDRWFHPYRSDRPIDILSVGRRNEAVHQRLLQLARRQDLFYHYQTARAPQAIDLRENQELLGRLCQSSTIHVNWPVDVTNPARAVEGPSAITARWFEAAASGAIVVGSQPKGPEFTRLFPYPDFVREIDSSDAHDAERVVTSALSGTSDREERRALAEYVRDAHTWSKRWCEIIEACQP